jgi:hypothetical protein
MRVDILQHALGKEIKPTATRIKTTVPLLDIVIRRAEVVTGANSMRGVTSSGCSIAIRQSAFANTANYKPLDLILIASHSATNKVPVSQKRISCQRPAHRDRKHSQKELGNTITPIRRDT